MVRYSLVCLMGLWTAGMSPAASWADSLFDELSRDFGPVPRGTIQTHAFHLTNRTGSPLHIASVRVSCGCTTASALQTDVEPGKSTAILAQMDTHRFSGPKTVTIFVQFDRPQWEEVRLWVQANSREDVSMVPESLAFGRVPRGSAPTAGLDVTLMGDGNWQVTDVRADSNYIQPRVTEVKRDAAEAVYHVAARIRPDAPVGKWYTDLWLETNNPNTPRVRIPLTVEIRSALSVSPAVAVLGQVKAGTEVERKVIVRGVQPFRITGVAGTDGQMSVRDSSKDRKPVHVLTVKFKAAKPGEVTRTLRVRTDLKEDSEIDFQAMAQVEP